MQLSRYGPVSSIFDDARGTKFHKREFLSQLNNYELLSDVPDSIRKRVSLVS
jgi:hypothetical protein